MKRVFASLDRHLVCEADFEEPDRYRDLLALKPRGAVIARGAGVSYVAASFGDGVTSIGMRRFNRILAFNETERWIDVEAGISIGELFEFLSSHNLTLPVQPGHPHITVGGCIAGNVHGKNQYREGLFGEHVKSLRLFHPDHGLKELPAASGGEAFDLTIGGFGLTGVIVSARLALVPLSARAMLVRHIPVDDLADAFGKLAEIKGEHDLAYAWIDLSDARAPGRGYIVAASAVAETSTRLARMSARPLAPERRRLPRLFTNTTLPAINAVYRQLGVRQRAPRLTPLHAVLYPAVGKETYFEAFGTQGFIEMQVLVPAPTSSEFIAQFLSLLRKHKCAIALTTLKAFKGESKLLHYTGSGFSFTIDIGNDPAALRMLDELDEINCGLGVITAIMKDSRLTAGVVRRQYPQYEDFKARLARYDGRRLFQSALSRRIGI